MNVQYIEPLKKAIRRMKAALFKPFDMSKWFILGFTAWLAGLLDGGGRFSYNRNFPTSSPPSEAFEELSALPQQAWQWLMDNPFWFYMIIAGIAIFFVLIIVFLWLSSRGKFMYLDNIMHDKAEVKNPWRKYKHLGDSLFIWRLCYTLICLLFVALMGVMFYMWGWPIIRDGNASLSFIPFLIVGGLVVFVFFIAIALISFFLENFIVPIMYTYDMTTMKAWRKFLPLFYSHIGWFILYGLFVLVLFIAVGLGLLIAFCLTCCILLLLCIIPYIGSVVLLPLTYTYRAFSIEFLSQFDEQIGFPVKTEVVVPSPENL